MNEQRKMLEQISSIGRAFVKFDILQMKINETQNGKFHQTQC